MSATGQVTYQATYQDWLTKMAAALVVALGCEQICVTLGDISAAADCAKEADRIAAAAWRGIATDRAIRASAYSGEWRRIAFVHTTEAAA